MSLDRWLELMTCDANAKAAGRDPLVHASARIASPTIATPDIRPLTHISLDNVLLDVHTHLWTSMRLLQ